MCNFWDFTYIKFNISIEYAFSIIRDLNYKFRMNLVTNLKSIKNSKIIRQMKK